MHIVDTDGVWLRSKALYPLPVAGRSVVIEPAIPTKIRVDPWIESQPCLERIEDPLAAPAAPAAPGTKAAPKK